MTTQTAREQDRPAGEQRSVIDWIRLAIGVAAGVLLVVFFLQNLQEVEVHFLWFDWNTGLIWALAASAVIGALGAAAFSTLRARARRRATG